MAERLHSISLVDFDTQSAGAELLVAAGGITVNAVNKIATSHRSDSRLCPVGDEVWYVRFQNTGIVQKISQADLSYTSSITLQWTGLNAKWTIYSICVIGDYIYGLVGYRAALNLKAIGKWDLAGNLVAEFIDYVSPPADGDLWTSTDMVSDGTYLYICQDAGAGLRLIKKFDLAGNYVAKCDITPTSPNNVCLGQDGYLYATSKTLGNTAQINPTTMALEAIVTSAATAFAWGVWGGINAVDESRIYKCMAGDAAISVQGVSGDNDYRGGFGSSVFTQPDGTTVATGRSPGSLSYPAQSGLDGDYLFFTNYAWGPFGVTMHKIYVRENRTAHTAAPVITGEADLKNKTGLVGPSYLRLAVQEDVDGGEIIYYRSPDGVAWTEVTRASGFDLSAHPAASPLYLRAQLDNLHAKVGSPVVYGIDVVAEGTPIPTANGGMLL